MTVGPLRVLMLMLMLMRKQSNRGERL